MRAAGKPNHRLLKRRVACSNARFDVFFDTLEGADGNVTSDFLIVRPKIQTAEMIAGICVLPESEGRVGLMCGYRYQLEMDVWQAPAGFVEAGEDPARTALRELEEETLLTCPPSDLKSLGTFFPDAGLIEGGVALFLACNTRRSSHRVIPHEEIGMGALRFFSRQELAELIISSGAIGGSTLVACYRYLHLNNTIIPGSNE